MCGRFVGNYRVEDLLQELEEAVEPFGVTIDFPDTDIPLLRNFNVAPTHIVPVLLVRDSVLQIDVMQWGLIPTWSKDPKIGAKMINARAETLTEKVSFKNLVRSHRCIIPMSGFYEWHREGISPKTPMYVTRQDSHVLFAAGLWSNSPIVDAQRTCSMITRESGPDLAAIHHRTPAHFSHENILEWLCHEMPLEVLSDVSQQPLLNYYAVSTDVNSVRHNRSDLLERVDTQAGVVPDDEHPTLF